MPSNILQADVGFPELTEEQTTDEKFQLVTNYLFMLREQLRYSLSNLDTNNFSTGGIEGLTKLITEPIYAQLEDEDGNFAAITAMADGLGVRIGNAEGQLTQLTATVDGLNTTVNDPNTGLTSQVRQNAARISLVVTSSGGSDSINAAGIVSAINLTPSTVQISADHIVLSGTAIFKAINGTGAGASTTSIDGGKITTHTIGANQIATDYAYAGTIAANKITTGKLNASDVSLNGLMKVYSSNSLYGYLGAYNGLTSVGGTTGVILAGTNDESKGLVAATTGGAKIAYGSNYFVAATSSGVDIATYNNVQFSVQGVSYMAFNSSCLRPEGDSANFTLGLSNHRWGQIYSTSSSISTSDRQKKHDISYDIDDYESLFDALRPVKYKFNDGTSNRYHTGFIAQDIEESLKETGFTSLDLGAFIKSPRYAVENPDGTFDETSEIVGYDYGLRYEEFIALAVMKIKKLEARIAALEAN